MRDPYVTLYEAARKAGDANEYAMILLEASGSLDEATQIAAMAEDAEALGFDSEWARADFYKDVHGILKLMSASDEGAQ